MCYLSPGPFTPTHALSFNLYHPMMLLRPPTSNVKCDEMRLRNSAHWTPLHRIDFDFGPRPTVACAKSKRPNVLPRSDPICVALDSTAPPMFALI
mmetsp:Transcript_43016/g.132930  ORF Transcript_43016/g.132930 Transcript_43016/m.132930 type:complete len:95 (+) Transcript_43016:225-509(+)